MREVGSEEWMREKIGCGREGEDWVRKAGSEEWVNEIGRERIEEGRTGESGRKKNG